MRFKVIECMLAMASLSALATVAADDNEKKREKSRKMAAQGSPNNSKSKQETFMEMVSARRRFGRGGEGL